MMFIEDIQGRVAKSFIKALYGLSMVMGRVP